ncbi:DUF317 domain-containing protein [Kitasatospora sp. A2-31]|uniref:DUF317 domain-containing protein n=1 Tax=Kitasatospora sp. A2-31 TaxID=2916414 RepID=UPI001EEBA4BA|nr:DUF317 domain-containing protein [Kitasatospora sp. A2-31]MCG6497084.1 DUF317 domain-containing protein [Kitasatospora sp. A2-31]
MTSSPPAAYQDEVLVRPRHLAGPGPLPVLAPLLHLHSWPYRVDESLAQLVAFSPDRRVEIAMEPHRVFHLYRVSVRKHPTDEVPYWQATFTKDTPGEIVGAFVQAIAADGYTMPEEIVAEPTASPTTAWRPLLKAGWQLQDDPDFVRLTSPDGTTGFTYSPASTDDRCGEGVGAWMAQATFGPAWSDQWTIVLGHSTPVRYLAILASAIADPAPVVRRRSSLSEAALPKLTTWPARPADPMRQFTAVEYAGAMFNPRHPGHGHPPRR